SHNITAMTYQTWNGSAWVNNYHYDYTFNGANKTSQTYQTWDGSAWVNSTYFTYTYDADGNLTQELHQKWNGSSWVNDTRITTTWQKLVTDVSDGHTNGLPLKFSLAQNYPNPFNPSTEVRFGIPASGFVSLKIYNVLGQEVATLVSAFMRQGSYTAT